MKKNISFINPEIMYKKLHSFICDYFKTSGFENAVVAVSGGIDSACIAYMLKDILNPKNVTTLFLPSAITGEESKICYELVKNNCKFKNNEIIDIQPFLDLFETNDSSLSRNNLRKGNIAARIRMILSYDIASKNNALVIGTENKTEYYLGYSTQWGDSAAAIHPMGDMYKAEVFSLAGFLNVPEKIIKRVPTAELWNDQTDEKEIGLSYSTIDQLLIRMIEYKYTEEELLKDGFQINQIERISQLVKRSEYKRRFPMICNLNEHRGSL